MLTTTKCNSQLSVKGLLNEAAKAISSQPDLSFQSPMLEARLLLSFASNKDHAWMISHAPDVASDVFSADILIKFSDALNTRLQGKPIAFIIGTQPFWTLELKVSDCTLIPRQDTEVLVETALALPLREHANVLDIGTGTGAIALALAKENPQWQVLGLDKVPNAVALAKQNALLNDVKANFVQSDWFSAIRPDTKKFDLIVSNPPYVESNSEYLNKGDLRYEPLSALVSGKDGLDDIRLIVKQASQFLSEGGYLLIEHGKDQQTAIMALFYESGFTQIQGHMDYNNLPRVTLGKYCKGV